MLRRNKRQAWELDFFPSRYEPKWSYCQPQRQDWPVYDADAGVYVEWSTATSHLESMLELDEQSCLQLRCIELFHRYARERGKSQKAPVYNLKKLSVTRGRWEERTAEDRCSTPRARAAWRWLYENNMTYRGFCDRHRIILANYHHEFGRRSSLYEMTYKLLLEMPGLEVAAWPFLYPWSRYGDTDVRERLVEGGSGAASSHYSLKFSFLRKIQSRMRSYEQETSLFFYLYDVAMARMLTTKMNLAAKKGYTADVVSDSNVVSDSYWKHEQDYTADLVRQMDYRCRTAVPGDPIYVYQHSFAFHGIDTSLAFPNLFWTIAPSEWKFPMHGIYDEYYPDRGHDVGAMAALHMYNCIQDAILKLVTEKNSQWFTQVLHYLIRLEYQDRGTIHFHVAVWAILKYPPSHYVGRTGGKEPKTSPFHAHLEELFRCHVDVQWTTGRLNYINGYTTKTQDSLDFRLGNTSRSQGKHANWLTVYRLLCRTTVCIPAVNSMVCEGLSYGTIMSCV